MTPDPPPGADRFDRSVFVNCPFDQDYVPLLRPMLFCILRLGFEPRIATERLDSGEARLDKLIEFIAASQYGIHDLSRLQAVTAGEYYRLNMPFELGLDVACRRFKNGRWAEKRCLVLEAEPYRYRAALSDIAGFDIAVHGGDPLRIVAEVRHWLNGAAGLRAIGPAAISAEFTDFMADDYDALKGRGFSDADITALPIPDLLDGMREWVRRRHPGG